MKAKFSPLQLLDFKLLETHYEFKVPESDDLNIKAIFISYPVEIDFDMGKGQEEGEIQLVTLIEVNMDKDSLLPGYKIMVEGGGTFKIEDSVNIEEGLKSNLSQFSTLNMMINNLRNVIFQITNLGPMGGYLLPPIDISKLVQDKIEQQDSE
jgi:preprotein translocase subunit SecB